MRRLQWLYDIGQLPDGLEPLVDAIDDGGDGGIYGVRVMTSEDGTTRADIIEYPGFWQVMETEMPLGLAGARSWKFSRGMELADLAVRVRAWGLDREASPEGWEWEYVAGSHKRRAGGPLEPPPGVYILTINPGETES